jgi:autotransporter-associated beta strand protein
MIKKVNIRFFLSTSWLLAGVISFLGMASGNAQEVTLLRSVNVNETVPDRGQYVSVSELNLADLGMASIIDVDVSLSLSSLNQSNPMWLGQVYASLTYGVASEGVRTAVLLNRPGVSSSSAFGSSLSSLNVTFDDSATANIFNVATGTGTYQADGRLGVNPYGSGVPYSSGNINAGLSALNGGLLQSNKWSLLVADTQQGAEAKLDSWGVKVTGTAASSGLLNVGAGGSVAATGATQSVGATIVSSGSGSGAVGLLATADQELNLSGGLSGSGEFNKTGSGTVKLGSSAGFTGTLNVNAGKVVVDGALAAGSRTVVGSGGLLGGSGTVGALTLQRGATLTPGNSPGILTAGSAVWGAGATYEWQLQNLTGDAGKDWDLFRVTGTLDMSGLSPTVNGRFNLSLLSSGSLDLSAGYQWTFVEAANFTGLSNLALGTDITNLFNIATTGMNVGTDPANVKVLVGEQQSNGLTGLNIWAVPEPSSQSLLAFGMVALVAVRSLRRKQS